MQVKFEFLPGLMIFDRIMPLELRPKKLEIFSFWVPTFKGMFNYIQLKFNIPYKYFTRQYWSSLNLVKVL